MNRTEVIDYAYPCMMAEQGLRDLHQAMLMRKYDAAIEAAHKVLVETKMTLNSIVLMKEKEDALHKVPQAVQA